MHKLKAVSLCSAELHVPLWNETKCMQRIAYIVAFWWLAWHAEDATNADRVAEKSKRKTLTFKQELDLKSTTFSQQYIQRVPHWIHWNLLLSRLDMRRTALLSSLEADILLLLFYIPCIVHIFFSASVESSKVTFQHKTVDLNAFVSHDEILCDPGRWNCTCHYYPVGFRKMNCLHKKRSSINSIIKELTIVVEEEEESSWVDYTFVR